MDENIPENIEEPTIPFKQKILNGWVARADCKDWVSSIAPGSVQLIAIDPPFFTGRTKVGSGESPPSYRDRWEGGQDAYIGWLMERVTPMKNLLAPEGSFLIHLDWHNVHAVKVALDSLFGEDCFQNEIIWYYQTGGASSRRFSRKHDTLLWYTAGGNWKFYPERIRVPRSPKSLERARNPKGARIPPNDLYKYPEDVVWVPQLNPMSKERTGYPTQKPLELMKLFIEALTDPGDRVADFFCGSGTTPVAAQILGRSWLGCDLSADAIRITIRRLKNLEERGPDLFPDAEKLQWVGDGR